MEWWEGESCEGAREWGSETKKTIIRFKTTRPTVHTDVLHDVYTKSKIKITSNKHTKTRSNQTTENEIMSSVSGRELVSIICVYLQCMAIHFIFQVLLTFFVRLCRLIY